MALTNLSGSSGSDWGITGETDNTNLADRKLKLRRGLNQRWKFGGGAGQINKWFAEAFNILASASENTNLQDASIKDPFGDTVAFVTTKGVRITHLAKSSASSIKVVGDFITSNLGASADLGPIAPGEYIDINFPMTVTVTTGDVLTITNNDGSNAADVALEVIGV